MRVSRLGLLVIVALAPVAATAQTPRILLVGDSWAARAWRSRAFETALENKGLSQFVERGDVTAIGGTTSEQWATEPYLQRITDALEAHPTIDIVHLSIGGNDFLQSGAPRPLEALPILIGILRDTRTVVEHIHGVRPEARIAYAVYDYVPAGDGFARELGLLARAIQIQARSVEGYFLLNNLGVLHHAFGYPGAFGPGETPLPGGYPRYRPFLGGDPDFPGALEVYDDPIHPNDAALVRLAEHAIDSFYGDWLAPTVEIDVRPGTELNAIAPGGPGLVPVAVLGTVHFDVAEVDARTLAWGPAGARAFLRRGFVTDVDRDGIDDLLAFFSIAGSGVEAGDAEVCLELRNVHGVRFSGCDAVWTTPVAVTRAR